MKKEIDRLLDEYEECRPENDGEAMERVKAVLEKSGMTPQDFERIQSM